MSGTRVLIVDDDAAIRLVIGEALRRDGYDISAVGTLAEMALEVSRFSPDLIITDVMLPDGNGLDAMPAILANDSQFPVIVLSAQNTLTTAVRASERGAFEYLPKPFDLDELRRAVREGITRRPEDVRPLCAKPELPLIGRSPAMQEVYRTIARVVGTELSVLILGESGTGKELVARALHDLGPRRDRPFVAVNMAAIPRELIEAELFGHERGAFTGAIRRTSGRFEQAAGGTMFLDEIGDMPPEAQTRLLRVLQTGEFTPVGGSRPIRANVRILAATHQDLNGRIAAGEFREDLFYRLNVVPIALPPLRQRGEDIVLLAHHFLEQAAIEGLPRKQLQASAREQLLSYGWPGNARELENVMRRLTAVTRNRVITGEQLTAHLGGHAIEPAAEPVSLMQLSENWLQAHFSKYGSALPPTGLYERVLAEVESALFKTTLAAVRGNQLRAAALLGINRNTLRKRLSDLGIEPKPL